MTEIESLGAEKGRSMFLLKGSEPGFVNGLRRAMIDSVPTMAIEEVEFRKNNSVLYDEMIAHRLGLLPLTTDLKSYEPKDECKCEGKGCDRCTLKLTLKAKGPGIVYASELKSKDSAVKPAYPNTPIVKLLKGQELEVEATAVLGRGSEHVKFSPCNAWYKYKPVIVIDEKKCSNADEVAKSCPVNVFDVKDSKLIVKRPMNCHLCGACVDIAANNSVNLNESGDEFVFFIEPWGQLTAREIFSTAVEILRKKLELLTSKLEGEN